ncbi:MAG: zinc ribbon domain-containing protein [Pirellulales bacterium]
MALIDCPECGRKNVSDRAHSCPDCGYPIDEGDTDVYESNEEKRKLIASLESSAQTGDAESMKKLIYALWDDGRCPKSKLDDVILWVNTYARRMTREIKSNYGMSEFEAIVSFTLDMQFYHPELRERLERLVDSW